MRTFKRIISAGLLVPALLLLAATGAYLLLDNAILVALVTGRLEKTAGISINYRQDAAVTRTLSPTFTFNDFVVEDEDKGFLLNISSLQLQVWLPGLVTGKLEIPLLVLGDTRVEMKQSAAPVKFTFPESLPFHPILHEVRMARLSVLQAGKEISIPAMHFSELDIKVDPDTDKLICGVQAELAHKKINVDAAIPRIQQTIKSRLLPFTLSSKMDDIELSADGRIDFNQTPAGVEARIHGQAFDLSKIPTNVKDLVLQGKVTGEANINGTFDKLAMEDLSATWRGPGSATAQLNGRIADIIDLAGLDLGVTGTLDQSTWLTPILPASLGPLHSADLSLRIAGAYKNFAIRDISLKAKTEDELNLTLAGQLDFRQTETDWGPENINLKLAFTAPTTRAARALLFDQVWEFGALEGSADISSSAGAPSVENIVLRTKDPKGIAVDLQGRINRFPLDPDASNTGYDLNVTMKADRTSIMAERLGAQLPLSGPLAVKYRIEGDTQALRLEKINLSAGRVDDIQVNAQGRVLFGKWAQADPLQSIDLHVQAKSHATREPAAAFGLKLPELGALSAKGRLHTVSGTHRIDDFLVETGKGTPLKASLAGTAAQVAFFPQFKVGGILLTAAAATDDSAQLNRIFNLQEAIPAIGKFRISTQITGSDQKLIIDDVAMKAGREDLLMVNAKGRLCELQATNGWQPQNADLIISAQSPGSRDVFALLGYHIPELGPITATAQLDSKKNAFGLESIRILVGEKKAPALEADGFVNDLMTGSGTRLEVKLAIDGHSLAAFADNRKLSDLQPLVGNMIVSDGNGSLGIDSLELKSTDPEMFTLKVNGQFDDFKRPETLMLDSNLNARDLQLVGALIDREWPPIGPVTMDGRIAGKEKNTSLDATFTVDKTTLHAAIDGTFHTTPPHISGKITARNLFFPDLEEKAAASSRDKKPADGHVFSRTPIDFSLLQKVDLDLSVEVETFDKKRSQIESARFGIALQSGQLILSPATLVYPKGKLEFQGRIDAREQPQVSFKAFGQDINPWLALDMEQSQISNTFNSDLDIDVKITSSGTSAHELAANMQGGIYVTMKDGRLRKALLDMIFVDLVGWTVSKATQEKYVAVHCGVADFSISQGVMSTKGLFLDTRNIAIAGEGTIDLGREQIDYAFLPRKKSSLILRADPVKIKGPLDRPAVETIPFTSAVKTYGSLFFAPYLFAGITAFDFLRNTMNIDNKKSACQEYERQKKGE